MARKQAVSRGGGARPFTLRTERLGPLPIVNHFLQRTGLEALLARAVPTAPAMYGLAPAEVDALGDDRIGRAESRPGFGGYRDMG